MRAQRRRVSEPLLECYLVGSLDAEARAQVAAVLAESEVDRARLEELRAESAAFLLRQPPGPLVERFEVSQHRWWRDSMVLWAPVLAIGVLLVLVLVDDSNGTEARVQRRLTEANAAEVRAQQRLEEANAAEARAAQRTVDAKAVEARARRRLAEATAAEARAQQRTADANAAETRAQQRLAEATAAEARAENRTAHANAMEASARRWLIAKTAAEACASQNMATTKKEEPAPRPSAVDFLRGLLRPKPKPDPDNSGPQASIMLSQAREKPPEEGLLEFQVETMSEVHTVPEPKPAPYQPGPPERLVLRGAIHFLARDSAELPDIVPLLDQAILRLLELPESGLILVEGHADSEESNARISSLQRAQAVRRYLIGQGVPLTQVRIRAFGSDWPVSAKPATEQERQLNRRVEVLVISQEASVEPPSPTP